MEKHEQARGLIEKAINGYQRMGRGVVVVGLYPVPVYKPRGIVMMETNDRRMLHAVETYDPNQQMALLWHDRRTRIDRFRVVDFVDVARMGGKVLT